MRHEQQDDANRYGTFGILTMQPFACGSFGSFTTVTYNSFSPSPKATLVVPSPAAMLKTCSSLPSREIFKSLAPDHCATYIFPLESIFMESGPMYQESTLFLVSTFRRA